MTRIPPDDQRPLPQPQEPTGRLDDRIEQLYREWDHAVDYEREAQRLTATLTANATHEQPTFYARRRHGWLTAVAIAAGVAVVIAVALARASGSDPAAADQTLPPQEPPNLTDWNQISSARFRSTTQYQRQPGASFERRVSIAIGLGRREDQFVGGQLTKSTIYDLDGWATFIRHQQRSYVKQVNPGDGSRNFFLTLADPTVFLPVVRGLIAAGAKSATRTEWNGQAVDKIDIAPDALRQLAAQHLNVPDDLWRDCPVQLWLNPTTRLPVRMRINDRGNGPRGASITVYDQFDWTPQPAALFEPPADYRGELHRVDDIRKPPATTPVPTNNPQSTAGSMR